MILRRVTEHVRDQNWFAVFLDFVIVVVGVFIGIQVANWNDGRVLHEREALLIAELRAEVLRNAAFDRSVGVGLQVGAQAARRILGRSDSRAITCAEGCWSVIVDLMHASQWQQIASQWSTYEELRRAGLPRDRRIIEAVEAYRGANHRAAQGLAERPLYRTLVRRRIPIDLQDAYWLRCFREEGQFEIYVDPCPEPDELQPINHSIVEAILSDEAIMETLREWTSIANLTGNGLTVLQQQLAEDIVTIIDTMESDP